MVATDTAFYVDLFNAIGESDKILWLFEPLFTLIVKLLMPIIGNAHTLLLLMAAMTTCLLLTGAIRLEKQPLLFATLMVPYQYFELTMNAARLGLAVGFSIWSIIFLVRGDRVWFIICSIIASQIHITSILLTAGTWLLLEARIRTVVIVSILGAVAFLSLESYIRGKFTAYTEIQTEGGTAGVAPLLLGNLAILAICLDEKFRKSHPLQLTALFVLVNTFFFLTQISYAGLRFQAIMIPFIYLYVAAASVRDAHRISLRAFWPLILFALMACLFRLRNYSALPETMSNLASPYIPYHFFWEMPG